MQEVIDFLVNNWGFVFAALFAISEVLAQIPAIKSNSIFQIIVALLMKFKPMK